MSLASPYAFSNIGPSWLWAYTSAGITNLIIPSLSIAGPGTFLKPNNLPALFVLLASTTVRLRFSSVTAALQVTASDFTLYPGVYWPYQFYGRENGYLSAQAATDNGTLTITLVSEINDLVSGVAS